MQMESSSNPCCPLIVAGCLQATLFQERDVCRPIGPCHLITGVCEEVSVCLWERNAVVLSPTTTAALELVFSGALRR